eukprot:m.41356 g.41356  ORF g.41356 m.41356 type:complete len:493 (-) comp10546_c0_seq1:226-1704(-)
MEELQKENARLKLENDKLRQLLEANGIKVPASSTASAPSSVRASESASDISAPFEKRDTLSKAEIARYGRQMILPSLGFKGQLALANASVLVVGAGGLGCPVGMYLAAAGVGRLGFVDDDEVDVSNLHRQVLHTEDRVGMMKVDSIIASLKRLNSHVHFDAYRTRLLPSNALDIFSRYDVVVDATDNAPTRYLINDACVLLNIPLVSGSALRLDGQLTVYNYKDSPCYRCLFPNPPPAATVTNCSDGGVLGAVPGTIGCMQAIETVKVLLDAPGVAAGKLLMFDARTNAVRGIKLRSKSEDCAACGSGPSRMTKLMEDYEEFCHTKACDRVSGVSVLDASERISVAKLAEMQQNPSSKPFHLIDIRPSVEYGICKLSPSINVPWASIQKAVSLNKEGKSTVEDVCKLLQIQACSAKFEQGEGEGSLGESGASSSGADEEATHIVMLCRRGNDSQYAVKALKSCLDTQRYQIVDVEGGITAWALTVDREFPVY